MREPPLDLEQTLRRLTESVGDVALELERLRVLKEFELGVLVDVDAEGSDHIVVVVDESPRNPGPGEGEVAPPGEALGEELRRQSIEAERKQLEREQKVNLREEWSQQQAEREAKQEG